MPSDPWFWALALILVVLLAALAIWLGRGLEFDFSGSGIKFKAGSAAPATPSDARGSPQNSTDTVTVAKEAEIDGQVGRIVGRQNEEGTGGARITDVGTKLKIGQTGKVDEITGISSSGRKPK